MSRAHMPPETWERFTNDPWGQRQSQRQEAVQVVEEEDEWELLRRAAHNQDLRFSVSRGVISIGRHAQFPDNERGVDQAWEYLDGGGNAA